MAASQRARAETASASAWHETPVDAVLSAFRSSRHGLTSVDAATRLAEHGPNRLPAAKPKSAAERLLAQFHNLLIYVLLVAAVITAALGEWVDSGVILGVVVLNAIIGFIQEGRAERALDAIRAMITPRATVLRDGERRTLPAGDVVPGDVLLLEPGDRVAADVRLIRAHGLRIEEAVLTGESVPVDKHHAPVQGAANLGDRTSMAYSGTLVAAGQGAGVVVATGGGTELGRISALLGKVEPLETPLIRQMNRMAKDLTVIILGVSAVTLVFAIFVRDYAIVDAFMAVVGMAVAAIPEGLPAVMTITLAIGVQRMAARNAIIRRLPAVETLGSVSTICTDKTGTLTRNEMMVTVAVTPAGRFHIDGHGYHPVGTITDGATGQPRGDWAALAQLATGAALCNDASLREVPHGWVVEGDPMEGALLSFAAKAGHPIASLASQQTRDGAIPFDATHKLMATRHRYPDGAAVIYVKGAPEVVIGLAARDASFDGAPWLKTVEALAAEGLRVLAIGHQQALPDGRLELRDLGDGFVLDGLVGLMDPPRAEVLDAIAMCQSAGIAVKMITGDHAATASAIAERLGLENPRAVAEGQRLSAMSDQELQALVDDTAVFARTSPEHKLRLVEALQADGRVVAMTGDGINDAPALKRADVGVAMGRNGTEAAKEASAMVLADDNFASIVAAVREGRTVYDNLVKVIGWTLPTSFGEMFIIVAAILFGLILPVTPVQILWINMVTAVALGLVLAFEPAEHDVMARKPRQPDTRILTGVLLWQISFVAVLMGLGAFGIFAFAKANGATVEAARTLVVNTVVVMEIAYLFSVRNRGLGSFTPRALMATPAVLIGVGSTIALQALFTYWPPMHWLFGTEPMSLADGAVVILVGVALFAILAIEKPLRRTLFLG